MEYILAGLISSTLAAGTLILLAALGEVISEKVGVMNLGIEGIMAMGAVSAIISVNKYGASAFSGLLTAMSIGLIFGAIYAFATVTLKANQLLCGLGLFSLGTGLARFIGTGFAGQPANSRFVPIDLSSLHLNPLLVKALFDRPVLVYIAYLVLPILIGYILNRTRHGINVRAVGENPGAADACGIPVDRIRFCYVCAGGILMGMAGGYLTLSLAPTWSELSTAGKGWIALALVIFGGWNPLYVVLSSLLFGLLSSFSFLSQTLGWNIPLSFLGMLPYVGTILMLVLPVYIGRNIHKRQLSRGPAAISRPYFREEE